MQLNEYFLSSCGMALKIPFTLYSVDAVYTEIKAISRIQESKHKFHINSVHLPHTHTHTHMYIHLRMSVHTHCIHRHTPYTIITVTHSNTEKTLPESF